VTATTGKLVFYGTYFIYSWGTFNPNGGTLEFNPVRQSANGITLRAPLAVENLIINPATNDKTFNIQNNWFEIAISGDLTFMDWFFGNGILTPQNAVIMKPAFDWWQWKIKINNNNIVSVETWAITPVFISWTSPTFNIYSWSHTYFWSDMNISALNLFWVTTLHTNSSPTIRTLSVSTYNHPIEPTLDYVIINPIAPTCPVPNSYIVWLENQSDWNCLGLKDPRYSTWWRSRNLWVDIPYDAVFYFVNTIGRPTNNNKFDTPWHFKFPVSDGILSWNTWKIEMKVKFFTQPE